MHEIENSGILFTVYYKDMLILTDHQEYKSKLQQSLTYSNISNVPKEFEEIIEIMILIKLKRTAP